MSFYDETDECPRWVKIDLDTPLEAVIKAGIWLFLFGSVFIYLEGHGKHPEVLELLPTALWFFTFFLALRLVTDNYYLLDRDKRQILYHFECAGIRRISLYLDFDQVQGIAIGGKVCVAKNSKWYEYSIQLVEKNGKVHEMSDWVSEDLIQKLDQKLTCLGAVLECPCYPWQFGHVLKVDRTTIPASMRLEFEPLP